VSSPWDKQETTTTLTSWVRSSLQTFTTGLGSDFSLVAHMERVTASPDAAVVVNHEPLETIVLSASRLAEDAALGPLAAAVQAAVTALIQAAYEARQVGKGA